MSYTTRETPLTSLTIREAVRVRRLCEIGTT